MPILKNMLCCSSEGAFWFPLGNHSQVMHSTHSQGEAAGSKSTVFLTAGAAVNQERAPVILCCRRIALFRTASLCTAGRKGSCVSCTEARRMLGRMMGFFYKNDIL